MGSIREPFLLTVVQFLVAAAIVGVVAVVVDPDTSVQRMTVVVVIGIAVVLATRYYRRSRDDTRPPLRHGETVGTDESTVRTRMIEADVLEDPSADDADGPSADRGSTASGERAIDDPDSTDV